MIYESSYWKEDLLKTATKLQRRKEQRRWPERSFALLEKEIMVGCFVVRKLIESYKVGSELVSRSRLVIIYPLLRQAPAWTDRWDFPKFYDMESPDESRVSLVSTCNQVIHSYVFIPAFGEANVLDGILIASDYGRKKHLHLFPIDLFVDVFNSVGIDSPVRHEFDRYRAQTNPDMKPLVFSNPE